VRFLAPTHLSEAEGLVDLKAGSGKLIACGLAETGIPYCWVEGEGKRLGWTIPPTMTDPPRLASLHAGGELWCGLTAGGDLWCWKPWDPGVPAQLMAGTRFRSVTARGNRICAASIDDVVYCWANGLASHWEAPELHAPPTTLAIPMETVSWTAYHGCGLTPEGAAYCWGARWDGRLGDGRRDYPGAEQVSDTPVPVTGGLRFETIATGDSHTCGITVGRSTYCWGWNGRSQVGRGLVWVGTPTPVVGGYDFGGPG
jgi:alpha-tubulin suppressor-like RCC1 family protein